MTEHANQESASENKSASFIIVIIVLAIGGILVFKVIPYYQRKAWQEHSADKKAEAESAELYRKAEEALTLGQRKEAIRLYHEIILKYSRFGHEKKAKQLLEFELSKKKPKETTEKVTGD